MPPTSNFGQDITNNNNRDDNRDDQNGNVSANIANIQSMGGREIFSRLAGKGVIRVVGRCEDAKENSNLDLSECQLMQVPDAVYHLMRHTELKTCDLSGNVISRISPKFAIKFNLITDLNLSHNQMSKLPDELADLASLIKLDISYNAFIALPQAVFKMPKLRQLKANNNSIIVNKFSTVARYTNNKMIIYSIVEAVHNISFKNPVLTEAYCHINSTYINNSTSKTPIPGRNIAAADTSQSGDSCEHGSLKYFALCGLGGIISTGLTHTMLTPLDLVKCRLQVNAAKYKSVVNGFRITIAEEGVKGLGRGWAPTLIGYSTQGGCKFGFYEVFKVLYGNIMGEEYSYLYRTSLYLTASASAEFIGDITLSPMEAAKVRIQTMSSYGSTLREAIPKMNREGINAYYKGLVPLWMRQIPYTMMKFASFERTLESLYKYVVPKPRAQCSKGEQLTVTFAAGYIAGIFCAIVSHPADTVVSKLNQAEGLTALQVTKKLGMIGIWAGLIPRIIMIGTLTAAQWFIYDGVKVFFRMPRPPPPEMPESLKKKLGLTP